MKTAIDWSKKPAPWCYIGPAYAAEVHKIAGRDRAPDMPLPDQSGIALYGRRVRAKLTQSELAHLADVSPTHINGIEQGKRNASPETWDRIDAALAKGSARKTDTKRYPR